MPDRRKSKLYTRGGDRGETGLFGGARVAKDDPRVAAYGTIDELNSAIGVAAAFVRQRKVAAALETIQSELFDLGAELASAKPVRKAKGATASFHLDESQTARLEELIDEYDAKLPKLQTFILPGGSQPASLLHFARTVARRAEREVVTLARRETVNPAILTYLNRLCDLLFALARYANKADRRREIPWRASGER